MSKVIHLADDAHKTAKRFCKQHGLRMSDWVATLVDEAIANQVQVQPPPPPKKKKVLEKLSAKPQAGDDTPPWEQPPFWKRSRRRN